MMTTELRAIDQASKRLMLEGTINQTQERLIDVDGARLIHEEEAKQTVELAIDWLTELDGVTIDDLKKCESD